MTQEGIRSTYAISRYSTQDITAEDEWEVMQALRSPWLTQGPRLERFELELAAYVGAKYAVAVSSGTAALHLAYLATRARNVMTTPLSFVATANAALLAGSDIGFVDVEELTGNADLHPGTWLERRFAWVPVHYAGRAAAVPDIKNMGIESFVIEDACHALGAIDFDGCSRIGSCTHSLATVFSFHPVKPITTGEGGAITTNDRALAADLRLLRSHGRNANGEMVVLGLNYRMTEIQAALGLSQLKRCDEMRERRLALTERYSTATFPAGAFRPLDDPTGAWHLYPIRIKAPAKRWEVMEKLRHEGIGTQVHYSPIIPLQPYYAQRFGYKPGSFPQAEAWAEEELSLPLHAGMTAKDVETVCAALARALK